MPGPFLPTRTPPLLIQEALTILMATITPLCQFYLRAAWILHLNVQSLYRFQSSLIPQTLTEESFYRLRKQWRGTGTFSEGSVWKRIEKRAWTSQCDKGLLSPLEKTLFSPDIEKTIYLLLHAGKRKDLMKDKVS